jgi:lipid-A-disaccharide synthase
MTHILNERLKKLLYRSTHRGCKETDYIFGTFAERYLATLTVKEITYYEKLIALDDALLYSWITEAQAVPDEYMTSVYHKVLAYHKLKGYKKIFIIAGEASGDLMGGKLVAQLKEIEPNLEIHGIGGNHMEKAGAKLLFHYSKIAIMGLAEVIPSIPRIWWLINKTVGAIKKLQPDVVVTIDSGGFNFRVAKRIQGICPLVHYVAPAVWAYKPQRARVVEQLFDHLLLLLPFEKKFFNQEKIDCTFVGHHIVEDTQPKASRPTDSSINLLVMPGSRKQEIARMGHIFAQSIEMFYKQNQHLNINIKVLTLPHIEHMVTPLFKDFNAEIIVDSNRKAETMLWADLGLIKSGTSAIEATAFGLPVVVAYSMSRLTHYYLKKLIQTPFITITNILLKKSIIPELVQEKCNPQDICDAMIALSQDGRRDQILKNYIKALKMLNNKSGLTPSSLAAETVLRVASTSIREKMH